MDSLQYLKEQLAKGKELTQRDMLYILTKLVSFESAIDSQTDDLILIQEDIADHEARILDLETP